MYLLTPLRATLGGIHTLRCRVILLLLTVLFLLLYYFVFDDEYNPDQQDYSTHMKILSTRVLPASPRPRTCNNCNVFNFKPIIKPPNLCSGDNTIDLLVLVTTVPKAWEAREAIRETWGSHTRNNTGNVRCLFLLGGGWGMIEQVILNTESAKYGDILQDDYKDAYYNLSYKMISGYRWAVKNCPRAKFILRTADDNFIHMPRVLHWVQTHGPWNKRVQIGHIFHRMKVHRYRTKKWYISYNEFSENYFPNYAVGTAFLYSMQAAEEIIQAAPNIPFFAIEDAWFGLVMREIKMETKEVAGFDKLLSRRNLREFKAGRCPLDGAFYDLHLVSADDMRKLWRLCSLARVKYRY